MTPEQEHLRTLKALELINVAAADYFRERNEARLLLRQISEVWLLLRDRYPPDGISPKNDAWFMQMDEFVEIIMSTEWAVPKRAGHTDEAKEFTAKAFKAGKYYEVLRLCMEYVEVE
jgi:hypothetical protein